MSVPDSAICQQFVWKSEQARAYAVALVQVGCQSDEFSAGDVPDSAVPANSPGLPGTVCHALVAGHIIQPVYVAPGQIKRVRSKRDSRNAAWTNCYTLCSRGVAQAFLRMNQAAVPSAQAELGIVVAPGMSRADGRPL